MTTLNLVFAGTPEFAAQHLAALIGSHHRVVGVYTQPDREAGRGRKISRSPVKQLAEAANLPVFQPHSLKSPETLAQLAALQADLMVVVAYGLMLPSDVLSAFRLGCLNVHASLLPRWRGAAPIQRALLAGDTESGISLMQMDAGLDTGPVFRRAPCPIKPQDTGQTLHDRLILTGCSALIDTLDDLACGQLQAEPQDETKACYAAKLSKAESLIDWQQPASAIDRQVRAFTPWPGTHTYWQQQRLAILSGEPLAEPAEGTPGQLNLNKGRLVVACGEQSYNITRLQWPGKKPVGVQAFLQGKSRQLAQHPYFETA